MNNTDLELLTELLLKLRTKEEINAFLKDVFSNAEQENLLLRVKVAKLLYEGAPYTQIERETGASSATIAKVSEYLKYGYNGYKTALSRIKS